MQENIEKLIMLNKRRRWFHSSRVKISLVLACQQVGFWCQHIWFGSLVPSWFCRTTNQAQLCGFLDTCLIVGLRPLIIILMTALLSSKNVQLRLDLRRMCVGGHVIHIWQTQSTMLSRVTHMTKLSEFICVMNVRNQCCKSSVACLSPFCDCSRKLVDRPQNVKSTTSCQVQAFQDNLWANFWQFSNWFEFLLFELMIIQTWTWNFVHLLHFLVCQFTVSLNVLLSMSLHVVGPR